MTRTQHKADMPVIARRLREARLQAGISQKKLGIHAGIDEFSSSARVNQYERGKHIPDYQTLEKFARVLRVPTPFFYARDDSTAELLLHFSGLSRREQDRVLSYVKKLGQKGGG